jgi:hypothetical protein
VEAGIKVPESVLDGFNSKPVIGDSALAEQLVDQCRAAIQCPEFPRAQRFGSRPPLARIFMNDASKGDRNAHAVVAVRDYGYTMKEVADFLGVHYITVSRALTRADGLLTGGNVGM